MLIDRLCHVSIDFVNFGCIGVGSLIDGSQSTVGPLAVEDKFRRIMKIAVTIGGELSYITRFVRTVLK